MHEKIIGLYPNSNQMKEIEIFGYSSRGIPGIEIIGLSSFNKILKEKLIYILRTKGVKLPLRRFVLSTSIPIQLKKSNQYDLVWLELPFYILLAKLLEIISIRNLENCLCSGKIELTGKAKVYNYSKKVIEQSLRNNTILIEDNIYKKINDNYKSILITDLLN